MKQKLVCSICGSDVDLDGEGGINGYFGICPVTFCVWCYSSITDMMEKVKCRSCPMQKMALKGKKKRKKK